VLPIEAILSSPSPTPPPGRPIGHSREGREIAAYRLGRGPLRLSLIAGCHADEPVGPAMLRRLQDKAREQGTPAEVVQAPAEDLPFEDASFDTVVSTLVLCGVDQERSLGEVRRVLRPGGRLLFLEHVRSEDPALARFQDRMNRLNRFLVGCECNRETLTAIEAAGFTISQVERTVTPEAPKFVRPLVVGAAVAA